MARETKLLIAEDSPATRFALRKLVESVTDLEVVGEAINGLSALEAAEWLKPDLILMDIELPGLDGIEVTRRLKKQSESTKVLMVTVHAAGQRIFDAFSCGADGYHLKSSPPEKLLNAIRTVINGGIWLDSQIINRVIQACADEGSSVTELREDESSLENWTANAKTLAGMGKELLKQGKTSEAEAALSGAIALVEKNSGGKESSELVELWTCLTDLYTAQGRIDAAKTCCAHNLKVCHKLFGPDDERVVELLEKLADLHHQLERHDEAEKYCLLALKIRQKLGTNGAQLYNLLAKLYEAQGQQDKADELLSNMKKETV